MARVLRELIGATEPSFTLRLRELEEATGRHTVDISLASDVLSKLANKLRSLGLDPYDTTHQELHAALKHKALKDDETLRRSYHGSIEKMFNVLTEKAPTVSVPIFKHASLKKVIKTIPPKKVMEKLGYRSVDSMLKRADFSQVLIGAFLVESLTWHRMFTKKLRALKDSDVIMERPQVVLIDNQLLSGRQLHGPIYVQSAGLVGIEVANKQYAGSWLHAAARAAEGLYLIHQRGVYLKLHRFSETFLKELVNLTYAAPKSFKAMNNTSIPWSAIYLHVANHKQELSLGDDPAVTAKDFFWKLPSEVLPLMHRQIDFWSDSDFLGKPHKQFPVSLCVQDIASDTYLLIPYQHSSYASLSRLLRAELLARYLRHSPDRHHLLRQIGIIP